MNIPEFIKFEHVSINHEINSRPNSDACLRRHNRREVTREAMVTGMAVEGDSMRGL